MSFNRNGFARIVVMAVLLISVCSITTHLWSSFSQKKDPIKIHKFEVQPSEFKVSENGELLFEVENLIESDSTTVTAYFETHRNVEIYGGNVLLAKSAGNYTYNNSLDPKEKSELRFTVKATLDVGDNLRNYYIKGYIYVNGEVFGIEQDTFTVCRS